MNDSQTRSLRNAVSFISFSLLAVIFVGGFFVSQAFATTSGNNITISRPASNVYWRGTQTVNWSIASTTGLKTVSVLYSKSSSATGSVGSNVVTNQAVSSTGTATWNTVGLTDSNGGTYNLNGVYYIHAWDNIGETSSTTRIYIDNTPPATTLATSSLPDSATGWYNSTTGVPTITLTCTDNLSGCSSIHYSWASASTPHTPLSGYNGIIATTPVSAVTPISLTGTLTPPSGDNILTYYSEDKAVDSAEAHNVEATQSREFKVDTVAPTIKSYTLDGKSADVYFNPNNTIDPILASTTIKLTADEPVKFTVYICPTGVTCTSSHGIKTLSTNSFTTTTIKTWGGKDNSGSIVSDGAYKLAVDIVDIAGNTSTINLSTITTLTAHPTITVDTVKPTITLISPVANTVYKGATDSDTTSDSSAISFKTSDTNPLTYTYSIDGTSTSAPVTVVNNSGNAANTSVISGLSDGRHTIVVTVTDGAGNSKYSAPISFVFDNNKTLTVGTVPAHDFSTIQGAVSAATAGDTIAVSAGAYTGTVNLNKSLILTGVSGADLTGQINVRSDGVTIEGMDITDPGVVYGIIDSGYSNLTVENNNLHNIGTNSSVTGSAQAIYINGGSNTSMSTINISTNTITNIGSVNIAGMHSSKGIYIGGSTGTNTISGVTIDGNTITNITASPTLWTKDSNGNWVTKFGRGAYGILVGYGKSTEYVGSVTGLEIKANTINTLNGLWAHAIGLEGNTPSAVVTGNIISNLTDNKSGTDNVGIMLQDNTGAGSVVIHKNQFTSDIIGVGNANAPTGTITNSDITNASGNWWGSVEGPSTGQYSLQQNPHGVGAGTYGLVSYVPWCTTADCVNLDTSIPTATLAGTPADPTNVTSISVTVGATSGGDDVVYYKYQIDGGAWSNETAVGIPITVSTTLTNGSHTLNVVGRDQAGNWQTTPTTYTWTVDTVPPVLTEVTPVTTPTKDNTPTYVFNTTKPGDITYAGGCDGSMTSTTTAGNESTTFATLSDGTYGSCTITVTDSAGNGSNVLGVTSFRVDTTAPAVNAGDNVITNKEVTQDATVTDTDGSGVATYAWTKASGPGTVTFGTPSAEDTTISAGTDGVYTLKLTATDNAGNSGSDTMQFTWDTTNPVIIAPTDVNTEATANLTPLTLVLATATDNLTATSNINITNDAPTSGFPVGTTIVTWTATDAAGNSATATQNVVITDTTSPTINNTPSAMTVQATSANGAIVTYTTPTATDLVDGTTDVVACLPSSGTTLALGGHTITCSTTDNANNSTSTSFVVSVVDTTPPVIASHGDMTVTADRLGGAVVNYTAPDSTDAVDGTLPAVCSLSSGSVFNIGDTTVTCTKTDVAGNTANPTTFTVTVVPDTLTTIAIYASPTSLTTANASTITVKGEDQYGNTVTSDNSTKATLSTDGAGSLGNTLLTLANGIASTALTSSSAGLVHVNAISGVLIPTVVDVTFRGASISDTTPPVITSIQSTNIGANSAKITWTTNENATSQVEYGTTSGYGISSTLDTAKVSSHSVIIAGLTSNMTYHFRVKSEDASNNLATSGDNIFTTVANIVTPTIVLDGGTVATQYTQSTAGTRFKNGLQFVVKKTDSYTVTINSVTSSATTITSSPKTITAVSTSDANTLGLHSYIVTVKSSTGATASKTVTYNVNADPVIGAPVISSIQAMNIGTSTATIWWTTNKGASSEVEYGTTSGYGMTEASSSSAVHKVTLTGLTSYTRYHFRVVSTANSKTATSGDNTFTTTVDNSLIKNVMVTGVAASSTIAKADNSWKDGWSWVFNVTVPTKQTKLSMEFKDFKTSDGVNVIPVASKDGTGNIRFYSPQSLNAYSTATARKITAAKTYSATINLNPSADRKIDRPGRQIQVIVEMRVPVGTQGGSYSSEYALKSVVPTP